MMYTSNATFRCNRAFTHARRNYVPDAGAAVSRLVSTYHRYAGTLCGFFAVYVILHRVCLRSVQGSDAYAWPTQGHTIHAWRSSRQPRPATDPHGHARGRKSGPVPIRPPGCFNLNDFLVWFDSHMPPLIADRAAIGARNNA